MSEFPDGIPILRGDEAKRYDRHRQGWHIIEVDGETSLVRYVRGLQDRQPISYSPIGLQRFLDAERHMYAMEQAAEVKAREAREWEIIREIEAESKLRHSLDASLEKDRVKREREEREYRKRLKIKNARYVQISKGFASLEDRNMAIFEDRKSGMKLRPIGEKYAISGDRVRQICLKIERVKTMRARKAAREAEERLFAKARSPSDPGTPYGIWFEWTPESMHREMESERGLVIA